MSDRFTDHEHPIPEAGVPYRPAWDEANGVSCLAWQAYRPGAMALRMRIEGRADDRDLCVAEAIGPPAVIAVVGADGPLFIVHAAAFQSEGWAVRRFCVTASGDVTELTSIAGGTGCIESVRCAAPRHVDEASSTLVYAAVADVDGRIRVFSSTYPCDGEEDAAVLFETPAKLHAARPAVHVPPAAGAFEHRDGGCNPHLGEGNRGASRAVLAFDAWDGSSYHVYLQTEAGVFRVSGDSSDLPGNDAEGASAATPYRVWHLFPDVLAEPATGGGSIWVCWIRVTDIANTQGVVDSRNEIMVARLEPTADQRYRVATRTVVEDLSHGLVDTAPDPEGVWGYLGRRRHPMLLRAGGDRGDVQSARSLLLWEQKRDHAEGTRRNVGVLRERELLADGIGDATIAACGSLWYETPGSKAADSARYNVAAVEGVYTDDRAMVLRGRGDGVAAATARYSTSRWTGWSPVQVPVEAGQTPRPEIEISGRTYRLYWFDVHCHSALSADAEGEPDECYRTARHKAGIDGMVITDNDHYVVPLNQYEWQVNRALADEFYEPGEFVPILGYEWTSRPFVGGKQIVDHRSVLLEKPPEDILRWNEAAADSARLYEFVSKHSGIVHAHHQNWNLTGHPVEANIEAASSWDAYVHREPRFYHEALAAGRRIGLIGGSDEHRRNPGLGGALTGIWAEELTRESILDALRRHRCFATSGRKPLVDFTCDQRVPMGGTARTTDPLFEIRIDAAEAPEAVFLLRDGAVFREWRRPLTRRFAERVRDTTVAGYHWYYVKIVFPGVDYDRTALPSNLQQARGPFAWTSPIWVEA